MFQHAYLEQLGNNKLRHEEQLVREDCQRRGLESTLYHAKQIQRRQLPLDTHSFICGDMDAMHGAMKQLGMEPPEPDDFPAALEPFFHRRVWRGSLAILEAAVDSGREIFASQRADGSSSPAVCSHLLMICMACRGSAARSRCGAPKW